MSIHTFVVGIVNNATSSGGSGVIVLRRRNRRRNDIWIATASHVIDGANSSQLFLFDYKNKKYTNPTILIRDSTYDYGLIKISNAPSYLRPCQLNTNYRKGASVFVCGWPLLFDSNSITQGVIRSDKWNSNGVMNQLLISAPIFGGNSGGGAFLNNRLVGIASWGLSGQETFNGFIPSYVIQKSLEYVIRTPQIFDSGELNFYFNNYYFGVRGYLLDPFNMDILNPTFDTVKDYASAGFIVLNVAPDSPASSIVSAPSFGVYDIIWAVSVDGNNWYIIQEEQSLDLFINNLKTPNIKIMKSKTNNINSVNIVDVELIRKQDYNLEDPSTFNAEYVAKIKNEYLMKKTPLIEFLNNLN